MPVKEKDRINIQVAVTQQLLDMAKENAEIEEVTMSHSIRDMIRRRNHSHKRKQRASIEGCS